MRGGIVGWQGTLLIVALMLLNEVLPVVLGTGASARWDYALVYTTVRWLVVPGAALLNAIGAAVLLFPTRSMRARLSYALAALASLAIAAYYVGAFSEPLPLFAR